MHGPHVLLTVWGVYCLALVTPGPNFMVIARISARAGHTAASWTALGVSTGTLLYAAAGMFGLMGVFRLASWLVPVMQIAGGAYLGYLGIRLLLSRRRTDPEGDGDCMEISRGGAYRAGLVNTLSNPETIGFFVSLFAVLYAAPLDTLTRIAMLVGIVFLSVGYNTLLAVLFSHRKMRAFYARQDRYVDCIVGAVMLAFGWRLAADGRAAILR